MVPNKIGTRVEQSQASVVDVELSVKPGLPAYAVRLKPGAVRELGLTAPQLASSLRAYVNGETATYWTTPDGNQVEVVLRLNAEQRERIAQLRQLPVAFAKDGTPVALDSVADIVEVFNPEVIRRQNLQRREAVFAGVKGRSGGARPGAGAKPRNDVKLAGTEGMQPLDFLLLVQNDESIPADLRIRAATAAAQCLSSAPGLPAAAPGLSVLWRRALDRSLV